MTLVLVVDALFDLPLSSALVRLRSIERTDLDTAFTLGLLRGIAVSAVLVALSFPMAQIYKDDRLVMLVCALSLATAIKGIASPSMAMHNKQIIFHRNFIIEIGGKLAAFTVSFVIAIVNHSYWAMAIYTIVNPLVACLISYIVAPYKPTISLKGWLSFASFLGWNSAGQLLSAFNWQFDRLLLGRLSVPADFGRYTLASDLSSLPEQALIKPIMAPLMSAFAGLVSDECRLQAAYAKANITVIALGLPMMLALSILAEPAVYLALGQKWLSVAPLLRWLAVSLIPFLFTAPLGPLAIALDKPKIFMTRSIWESCIKIPLVSIGAIAAGFQGTIIGLTISSLLVTLVSMNLVKNLIGTSISVQIFDCWRPVVSALIMTAVLIFFMPQNRGSEKVVFILMLMLSVLYAGLTYIVTLFVAWYFSGKPAGLEASLIEHFKIYKIIKIN